MIGTDDEPNALHKNNLIKKKIFPSRGQQYTEVGGNAVFLLLFTFYISTQIFELSTVRIRKRAIICSNPVGQIKTMTGPLMSS